jgi:hypothetical protein
MMLPRDFLLNFRRHTSDMYYKAPVGGRIPHTKKTNIARFEPSGRFFMAAMDISKDTLSAGC